MANLPELMNTTNPMANTGISGKAFLIFAAKNKRAKISPITNKTGFLMVKATIPIKGSAAASLIVIYSQVIGEADFKLFGKNGI